MLGVAGCGGTLVARSLRRNPVAVSMSGDAAHWTGTDEMGIVRNRMQRLPRVLWGDMYRDDIADEIQGTSQLFGSDALLHHYRRTAADATPEDARRFVRLLREHIAVYARDPRNARFVDKTHAHTVRIPLLAALLAEHDPQFVLVMRDPYGTCPWQIRKKLPSFRVELPYEQRLELAPSTGTTSTAPRSRTPCTSPTSQSSASRTGWPIPRPGRAASARRWGSSSTRR